MKRFSFLLLFGFAFLLSGCVVRTYESTKDRIDQDLYTGNRGYLMGKAPAEETERKSTREIRVVEVELGSPLRFEKRKKAVPSSAAEENIDTGYMNEAVPTEAASQGFEKYTVQKNDTLQKISQKYFGTTKKWMKIYDANRDVLKGPDKIRPGQVLNIPQLGKETMKEPAE
ncbi:MAG: LysM peptidoglycan-binding domain-containing protein, partial [candidate division Zixibacteria bacterium]|nr:LysM peptidoglycan-binding domain-containing protein [candidate division Zixibacteria bacterium]